MDVAKFSRYMERAVSTAPPPGTTRLDSSTLFTTQSESCSDRSISSTIKSLAPRRMMEAALRAPGLRREWRRRRGGVTERKKPGGRREEGGWCERREGEAGEEYRSEELAIPVSYSSYVCRRIFGQVSTTFTVARRFWKIWLIAAPLVNLSRCNVWITSYPAKAVTPRFPLNISVARMFHAGLLYCIMEHLEVGENPAQLLMLTATHWH